MKFTKAQANAFFTSLYFNEIIVGMTGVRMHEMSEATRAEVLDAILVAATGLESREELDKKIVDITAVKDGAYSERNKLVSLLSRLYPSHLCIQTGEWEDDWRTIVCVNLPTGQATWHIHKSEVYLFDHLKFDSYEWDGHTTREKYERVLAVRP